MVQCDALLQEISYTCIRGKTNCMITDVVYDSRKIKNNCMFVCLKGNKYDGHDFINDAIAAEVSCIVVEKDVVIDCDREITIIRVEDTRYALAYISAAYFGHPARKLITIGITGTKGKTTTTYMVKSILEHAGYKVGLIGTIEVIIGECVIASDNTTPESYLLQNYFARMVEAGIKVVVMEVSSQGLMLNRTQGFVFDYGIFTNIREDHIGPGEHKDFEEYLSCKGKLFKQCRIGIVNMDDWYYKSVIQNHTCKIETYGFHAYADYQAKGVELTKTDKGLGVSFCVGGKLCTRIQTSTPGMFSVYNALTAVAICHHFDIRKEVMAEGLNRVKVKGRVEPVLNKAGKQVIIDYAHNAYALESLLKTLRAYRPERLICVFGCGGNRAKSRRYEMGEVSGKLADITVITSDNPRFEDPHQIIRDIVCGIEKTNGEYVTIADRKEAIRYALEIARAGDIIVLAGKGHEIYQEIKGEKYPMDERLILQEI